jgi:hypothetical protein
VPVETHGSRAAAAARIGAGRALRERSALIELLRSCFARTQTWLQAGKYVDALVSDLPSRNGCCQQNEQTSAACSSSTLRAAPGRLKRVRD